MSYIQIFVHCIWATKERYPYLRDKNLRDELWNHIYRYASEKDIHIDTINGSNDHCHCLISLQNGQSIDNIIKLLKGESSHWINQSRDSSKHFEWQKEYFAVSISPSVVEKVRGYIRNQEIHHHKKTFIDEYNEFISSVKNLIQG